MKTTLLGTAALPFASLRPGKAAAAGRKPNLVFILADDIGETTDLSGEHPDWT